MNLAFCLFNYFPFGGLQRDFIRIAKECVKRGHRVSVYTMRWEGEYDPDFSIRVMPVRGLQNHTRTANFVKSLQSILLKTKYDRIIGFNKMPGLDVYYAADSCFKAKAYAQHRWAYRCLPRYRQLLAFEKAVFAEKLKTKVLLIAPAEQAKFMHYYHTEPQRFHLLPPGIAKDRLAPANAADIRLSVRSQFKLTDSHLVLLLVGSGFKTKGLDRAIKGIAALPHELLQRTFLWVVGKDNPAAFIRQAKREKIAAHIDFLGGRDDVAHLMLAADLLVHPAYYENTGTVLLEALAAGLPVLTTDVCGYAHYIVEANAGNVLPSPFQQAEWNAHLQKMLTSSKRSFWKKNGLEFAKYADIYDMPNHAVDVIEAC